MFWIAGVIALAAMAYTGAVGWDAKGYWKAVQSVHHNSDPYSEDIVALQGFHERLATKGFAVSHGFVCRGCDSDAGGEGCLYGAVGLL